MARFVDWLTVPEADPEGSAQALTVAQLCRVWWPCGGSPASPRQALTPGLASCWYCDKPQEPRAALRAPLPPAAAGVCPPEPSGRRAALASSGRPEQAYPPCQVAGSIALTFPETLWLDCKRGLLMARRLRIRQAIEQARGKHRDAPGSPPLGDKVDARAGTRPSVPGLCEGLSGVPTPAPAWTPPPRVVGARESYRQAGLDHLMAVTKRRWWWLCPPFTTDRYFFGISLELPAFNIAAQIMKIELQLFRVRMSLNMWISQHASICKYYTS